jgi:hypothetical protein
MSKTLVTLIALSVGAAIAPSGQMAAWAAPVETLDHHPGWEAVMPMRATTLAPSSTIERKTRAYKCKLLPSGVYLCW